MGLHTRIVTAFFGAFAVACGGGATPEPSPVGDPPVEIGLPTAPLSQIAGTGAAVDALPRFGPFLPPADAVTDNGFITREIVVVLDPSVSVEVVNAALSARSLAIAYSSPPSPMLVLTTPPLADEAAAEALVDALEAGGVAIGGWPSRTAKIDLVPGSVQTLAKADHLTATRFPAAWNVRALATGPKVPVVIADSWAALSAPQQIDALRFAPGVQVTNTSTNGFKAGNHGFCVASVVGADFDGTAPTGTSPDPTRLLDLIAVDAVHVSSLSLVGLIEISAPKTGHFIVNASLHFPDAELHSARAAAALEWRRALRRMGTDRVLVIPTAGNNGDLPTPPTADKNSMFTLQARIDDLTTTVPGTDKNLLAFLSVWNALKSVEPENTAAAGATLIVGGSTPFGDPSSFSTPGHDVRMVAESVECACVVADVNCRAGLQTQRGTSFAAPAVAGLAAYLWAIAPELAAIELREKLLDARDGDKWIDAFNATLSLETFDGPPHAIRRALVDAVDPIGRFDEGDVQAIGAAIIAGDASFDLVPSWSRFDLDGDGYVTSQILHPFDIDGGGVKSKLTIDLGEGKALVFDETIASDLAILCYWAYSPDYRGNAEARDAAIGEECESAFGSGQGVRWIGTLELQYDFETHWTDTRDCQIVPMDDCRETESGDFTAAATMVMNVETETILAPGGSTNLLLTPGPTGSGAGNGDSIVDIHSEDNNQCIRDGTVRDAVDVMTTGLSGGSWPVRVRDGILTITPTPESELTFEGTRTREVSARQNSECPGGADSRTESTASPVSGASFNIISGALEGPADLSADTIEGSDTIQRSETTLCGMLLGTSFVGDPSCSIALRARWSLRRQ